MEEIIQYLRNIAENEADKMPEKYRDMFIRTFMNTIETTVQKVEFAGEVETFIITGDIPAMWLRDAYFQVHHYLPYMNESTELKNLIKGLIIRQTRMIELDAYANAFNIDANDEGYHRDDMTDLDSHVWERKYEIDSLCAYIRLVYEYMAITEDKQILTQTKAAFERIVEVWTVEQDHAKSPYFFMRNNVAEIDTLPNNGYGNPVKMTGMTWSGFRPSDDRCKYGYLIPSNFFAVSVLKMMEEMYKEDKVFVMCIKNLFEDIQRGIQTYGIVDSIYAYEVDGYGSSVLMDDANLPSLLSLPWLAEGMYDEKIYENTRHFILSDKNPCYGKGKYGEGIGSPHTPDNSIWPIALATQALVAKTQNEKEKCIEILFQTTGDTGWMHESFNPNNPNEFTRPWFAWSNSMFASCCLSVWCNN